MKNLQKLFILAIMVTLVTGCGKIPTLKDGEQAVATTNKGSVSAEELYQKLKFISRKLSICVKIVIIY